MSNVTKHTAVTFNQILCRYLNRGILFMIKRCLTCFVSMLLVILALVLIPAYTSQAMMVKSSLLDLTRATDTIIEGQVTSCSSEWNADHTNITTKVVITVEEALKGKTNQSVVVVSLPGGQIGNITETISDTPIFIRNEKVVVFLDQAANGKFRVRDGVQGKFSIKDGKIGRIPLSQFKESIHNALLDQTLTDGFNQTIVQATGPTITSITPDSSSAGTNNQVTIYGSDFGSTAGKVYFFYYSGGTNKEGTIISWSDTSIVTTVPTSASSGPVYIRTAAAVDSNKMPFTVTFSYGSRWEGGSPIVKYQINPSGISGAANAIQNAANTWNNAASGFSFVYDGTTTATTASYNGLNQMAWNDLSSNIIAQTTYWSMSGVLVEADIIFNTDFPWSDNPIPTQMDIETITLHELGHFLQLRDLYGNQSGYPQDSDKVMYGLASAGLIKRSLDETDEAGIHYIYPLAAKTLQSIAITRPAAKLTYAVGEPLDLTGIEITGTYNDNSTQTETITAANITGFDSAVPKVDQILTINVGGKTTTYTVQIVEAVAIGSFLPDKASPQTANTTITWTCSASGGNTLTYQFYVRLIGGTWKSAGAYSTTNAFAWKPTTAGSYQIAVWVKYAGSLNKYDQKSIVDYTVVAPANIESFIPDKASPQTTYTTITWTCSASGNNNLTYQFYIRPTGGTWKSQGAYSTTNTLIWQPTMDGSYQVAVWVKAEGSSNNYDVKLIVEYAVTAAMGNVAIDSLASDKTSPQVAYTPIVWTCTAIGGNTINYQFWVRQVGGSWKSGGVFSNTNAFLWKPTAGGNYQIAVWVKDISSSNNYDAKLIVDYSVTALPVIESFTSDPISPQAVNTPIKWTCNASGGTSLSYQFWTRMVGGSWKGAGAYSATNTYIWTPTAAGNYEIAVWVKDVNSTSSNYDQKLILDYVIIETTAPIVLEYSDTAPELLGQDM